MRELAIESTHMTRRFGAFLAVDSISLQVPRGSVYGFLGRDGAGKTTTLRMILGLIRPDGGQVRILGNDVVRQRTAAASLTGALAVARTFSEPWSGCSGGCCRITMPSPGIENAGKMNDSAIWWNPKQHDAIAFLYARTV